ncbi:MAG: alpha-E domain-containing protein [Lachnospiraceae bacterium]
MDTITLSKKNRLFWLGRYAERVYQGVEIIRYIQDLSIDNDSYIDLDGVCNRIGIKNNFASAEDFCLTYAFDKHLTNSMLSTAEAMLGNGMVLRELLGSPTLSYLQMAVSALEIASTSSSYALELQWVLDDIMAFKGSYNEFVDSEKARNTIKTGSSLEKLTTVMLFYPDKSSLPRELHKLINRVQKTNLDYNTVCLERIEQFLEREEVYTDDSTLLYDVMNLVLI